MLFYLYRTLFFDTLNPENKIPLEGLILAQNERWRR